MDAEMKEMFGILIEKIDSVDKKVDSLDKRTQKIELTLENDVSKKIDVLYEQQSLIVEKTKNLDKMETTLEDVKSDTDVIKYVVTEHSSEIKKQA